MNIRFAQASEQGSKLVHEGLSRLARRPHHPHHQALQSGNTLVHAPHPIFDLGGDALAMGSGLESVKASGLRYLVKAGDQHLATAEVQFDTKGQPMMLSGLHYGLHAQAAGEALAQLATSTKVAEADASQEVRLLRCSAVGLLALWLKSDAGAPDQFIPLAPAPKGLQAGQSYGEAALLDTIRPIVERRPSHKTDLSVP